MYVQTPAEALVNRLLIAVDRSELDGWGTRLLAESATLHLDEPGHRVDLHGREDIIAQYLSRLPEMSDGALLRSVDIALADGGATVAFPSRSGPRALRLRIEDGRISELWAYPSDAEPPDAAATPTAHANGGSCCGH